jgi:hypothetical protein
MKKMEMGTYQHGEGRTGLGQAVEFECPPDKADQVRQFLAENVRRISIPMTKHVMTPHGTYGGYTRYDMVQHKYAGGGNPGGGGFIEVLEIKNPPDGRHGIVIYQYDTSKGSRFSEWKTLSQAISAWDKYALSGLNADRGLPLCEGFIRRVQCSALRPWFYAKGDELLIGDYVYPDGLQEDEVYRFGQKFIVYDGEDNPRIKTCMGCRFVTTERRYHPYDEVSRRFVFWDDGTMWDEASTNVIPPRPAEDGELWIAETLDEFARQARDLLAGKITKFEVRLANGDHVVCQLTSTRNLSHGREGSFLVKAYFEDSIPREGWVQFKPTQDAPDIATFVLNEFKKDGKKVTKIEVKRSNPSNEGKKWLGVYFAPKPKK